jgi:hypothetical protein
MNGHILGNLQKVLFLEYALTLTEWTMVMTIAHQMLISEVQNIKEVLLQTCLQLLIFVNKFFYFSGNPILFKAGR